MKLYSAHQSSFLPWIGFWDKVNQSEIFDLGIYDQFTADTWQNYTYIGDKTAKMKWGLPLAKYDQSTHPSIKQIKVIPDFSDGLLTAFFQRHNSDKFFNTIFPLLENWLYSVDKLNNLWEINNILFQRVYEVLDLSAIVVSSPKLPTAEPTNDIIDCASMYKCDSYYSGPHGKYYLKEQLFPKNHIKLIYQDSEEMYHKYPVSIVSTISSIGIFETKKILLENKLRPGKK